VADDEPQLLRLMARVLERGGYAVQTARDGAEAVRAFEERGEAIEILVLDAAIVPRGGNEVLEAALDQYDSLGIVLTSGAVPDGALRDLVLQHDGVFLRKPFPPSALLRAVEDSLIKGAE
jgi:DNA-binding response OmpR family regulator